ncbi:BZ3500_MvSof-1268-A1-R1_Chr4-2g07053 [Microbotryum saponariae]|uniref:BZ3500_MvSof-1268-A1-R1_Chr4-2g07053 protein n=1 Tax=Microbotryum saponariae TaxID=289078 RepID=A0A2X0KVU3_9BASI|nr:BZ3500_MvSof-1268-A1-R1_Chr4-2g07053 [Microbotryum saponariae]SDA06718.1 BZ3501_MvSof-1269-A2-R1_Chr4-2g06764 [Microbotryum saponariae]
MSNHAGDSYAQEDAPMRAISGHYDDQERPRQRSRSRSRSPLPPRSRDGASARPRSRSRSPPPPRRYEPPPPRRPAHAPVAEPSNVLGVFGLSIRTTERDLEDEFSRSGKVEKVVIVYDARSDRSRGFGFVTMADIDGADRAISDLNGMDLHGRRIRVDFSATKRPHDPTPGQYRGIKRDEDDFPPRRGGGGGYDDRWGSSRGTTIPDATTATTATRRVGTTVIAMTDRPDVGTTVAEGIVRGRGRPLGGVVTRAALVLLVVNVRFLLPASTKWLFDASGPQSAISDKLG